MNALNTSRAHIRIEVNNTSVVGKRVSTLKPGTPRRIVIMPLRLPFGGDKAAVGKTFSQMTSPGTQHTKRASAEGRWVRVEGESYLQVYRRVCEGHFE